jgi:dUTP pyrophosphatase
MIMHLTLDLCLLPHAEGLGLPFYATPDSAGLDVMAAIETPITLDPGHRALVSCGFQMALPRGFEAQLRPRSGLAFKHGVTVLNAPGTIDSDYRGEVKVLLINHGQEPFTIERGMRIAQMVVMAVSQASVTVVPELAAHHETTRAAGGFGSTGLR